MTNLFKWLCNSGLSVIMTVNPAYWQWVPQMYIYSNAEWPEGCHWSARASWLFFRIDIWLDDGSW